tara:strand:- start:51476 stop:52240 length:765 start_codon:yes stop_codon:yes gene_type:complete
MENKRIIGTVIIKENWAVQSFGYKNYLPIGKPELVVENLNWWGADEILVIDTDSTKENSKPNYGIIEKIVSKNLSTPLIYSGGIHDKDQAKKIIGMGVERICLESLLYSNYLEVENISEAIGSQAVIISVPLIYENGKILYFNYINKKKYDLKDHNLHFLDGNLFSEILIIDKKNEGGNNTFDMRILEKVLFKKKIIVFGGISRADKINRLLKKNKISAIAIGNSLNYSEISIQNIKKKIKIDNFRKPFFNEYE